MATLADKINPLTRYIPEELISRECLAYILSICRIYNFQASDNITFESHLNNEATVVDLSFGISTKAIKRFKDKIYNQPGLSAADPVFLGMFNRWEQSDLDKYLEGLWFEFDYKSVEPVQKPDIIFHPFNQKKNRLDHLKTDPYGFLTNIIGLYDNAFITRPVIELFENCRIHLQNETQLTSIGFPYNRKNKSLRLGIVFYRKDELFTFLEKIGLTYRDQLDPLVTPLINLCGYLFLHLDITSSLIHPRIGIEFRLNDTDVLQLEKQDQWRLFLDYLVENQYCAPVKADGLKRWIGQSREITEAYLIRFMIKRLIYEIKLVFEPDTDLFFKAYFGFAFFELRH